VGYSIACSLLRLHNAYSWSYGCEAARLINIKPTLRYGNAIIKFHFFLKKKNKNVYATMQTIQIRHHVNQGWEHQGCIQVISHVHYRSPPLNPVMTERLPHLNTSMVEFFCILSESTHWSKWQGESGLVWGSCWVVARPQTSAKGQVSTVWNQSMKPIELPNKE